MKNLSSINESQDIVNKKYVDELAESKVDKVDGKGLSTNDFTDEEKQKLADLSESAYTLPVASDDAIGGVKSGTDITVDNDGNVSINDNSHNHTVSNISDLSTEVLTKTNETEYIPTNDYNPATKKYVDDNIGTPAYDKISNKPTLNGITIEGNKSSEDYSVAGAEHEHEVSDITGLTATVDELNYVDGVTSNIQTQLNNKAASTHNHTANEITDLSKSSVGLSNVENKSSETIRSEITANNITTALTYTPAKESHNHTVSQITDLSKSSVGLGNVENKSSSTIRSEITSSNVTTALGFTPMNSNLKGANSGVAELDANGKVPTSQLPSYVDDVLEYSAKASFPTTGETGKIYVDLATNLTYRWSGSAYTEISPSLALGETSSTAYRGDRGKTAYDHSQVKDGSNPHGTTFANIASKPTTISGYGITDAKIASGTITLGSNTITPLTSSSSLNASNLSSGTVPAARLPAASTSANGAMSSADKSKMNYTNIAYGTCSTDAATAAKVITVSGNTNWALTAGSRITIKFSATNTASNPTFNVNGTGAKSVWYGTAVITTGSLSYAGYANRPMDFVYDGTQYVFIGWSTDNNTTYTNASLGQGYGTCSTAEATAAKVVTLSSYSLTTGGVVSVKFTYAVPASATMNINSKGAKAIYHKGAAIKAGVINAGDTATFIYNGTYYHLLSVDNVGGSGGGATEVYVGETEPTEDSVLLWIDPGTDAEVVSIMNYKGEYSSTTSYEPSDVVYYSNVWYLCHASVTGTAPDVSKQFTDPYWYPLGIDKAYVDTQITSVNTQITNHTHTANKITSGTFPSGISCATPTSANHIVNKSYADTKINNGSGKVTDVWTGTQAQYNAITSKSSTTLYLITG